MVKIMDMQEIRYLNLFSKITQVMTRFCFRYNETIIFCVPRKLVSRAIGEGGKNIKKISEIIGKRVKVISIPAEAEELKKIKTFIEDIVSPVKFKDLNLNGDKIVLTAGGQSKALLIGRNKKRLFELQKISEDYFNKELKIV
jgi:NusA-like KH domain protein